MHKEGEKAALFYGNGGQIDVPKTGEPLGLDLTTARPGKGHLLIASWIGDDSRLPFDWRYQLSVTDGGIIERKGQFDFEAPEEGYEPVLEINMPAAAKKWSAGAENDYFVKLADGRYARFSIRFYPGDRNFVVIESFVNPKPGSRNLEFDPAKVVKSR